MVGINKPSLHFYTNQIVKYESHDEVGLVNLSNRLRFEVREKWKDDGRISDNNYETLLIVIDKHTSNYKHWKDINKEELASFGIYKLWRLEKKDLEIKEQFYRSIGYDHDWREIKNERY